MQIRITPQELYDGATDLNAKKDEIIALVEAVKAKVDEVTSNWEGAAQQSYFAQFEQLYPTLHETFPQCIEGMATMMRGAGQTLEQTDQDIASSFNG